MNSKPPIVFLLAVWGQSFIEKFFNFGLRSLLAPGNIPAMSEEYACAFLFLTTDSSIPFFKKQAAFAQLESYCSIEFIDISDLIFKDNYSATLTIAYERGMRSRGDQMCNTYFFFLVSDYIIADGSLHHLKPYLKKGVSGITTGNFLVVEEYMAPLLQEKMGETLVLKARELLSLAFPCMHPVSIAQTVTQNFTHTPHANRLFWKVSDTVLLGRFYLRHMLCIKPELADFIIGASCDYSFIPEMCPSGNVAHIQDSDEYCAIEMAPYTYEQKWIRSGPFSIQKLVHTLSEWTTHVHRANAHIPTVYHSEDCDISSLKETQSSHDFIHSLEKQLSKTPQPIRGHYYWVSCIEQILYSIVQLPNKDHYYVQGMFAGILGNPSFASAWDQFADDRPLLKAASPSPAVPLSKKQKFRAFIKKFFLGNALKKRIWHLGWVDDYYLKKNLKNHLTQYNPSLFIAFEPIPDLLHWLEKNHAQNCTYQFYDFLMRRSSSELQTFFQNNQGVIIYLTEADFNAVAVVIRKCIPLLPPDAPITIYFNHKTLFDNKNLEKQVSIISSFFSEHVICEKTKRYGSFSRVFLKDLYTHCLGKTFAPNENLKSRIGGMLGLAILNTLSVGSHLLSLLKVMPKNNTSSAMLLFRRKK